MPAVSKSQQRLMGMVHAYQKGGLKHPPKKVRQVASHIKPGDATDFAGTKHKGLPGHVKKAAAVNNPVTFLGGVVRACVEQNLPAEQTAELVKRAAAACGFDLFIKLAAGAPKLQGMNSIADPNAWGVPPGQKPGQQQQQQQVDPATGKPVSPQQQLEMQDQQVAAQKVPMNNVKNQGGIAPLPHRYRFDLDETVLRIKRDQIAFAQKMSREAQKTQHQVGVGPTAQQPGQTGPAPQHIQQQNQQQAAQTKQLTQATAGTASS